MKKDLDALMEKHGIDAVVCVGGPSASSNTYYLLNGAKVETCFVVKKRGSEPVLINIDLERDEAAKSGLECVSMTSLGQQAIYREAANPFEGSVAFMKKIFEHFGIKGTVAFYGSGGVGRWHALLNRLNALDGIEVFENGTVDIFSTARTTKEDYEIDRILAVGEKAQRIMSEVRNFISTHREKDGLVVKADGSPLTIGEVKARIDMLVAREGLVVEVDTIFAQGRDAGIPHSRGTDENAIATGKPIVFDFFPNEKAGGYFWDMTRTFVPGHVPEEVRKIYDHVLAVQEKAFAAVEVGKSTKELDEITCDYFEEHGYPTSRKNPGTTNGYMHSLGHGVGIDIHEEPRLTAMAKKGTELAPGHVFTIEPGLYFPDDEIGVRIEDVVAIRENGKVENLTTFDKDPLIPLAG